MRATPTALRDHLLVQLLPLWRERALDPAHGGFVSRLTPALAPVADGFKRVVVQARQLYSYARAVEVGAGDWAAETADATYAFLLRAFRDREHGGWFLTTTPEGQPLDRRKDTYAHAFVLFGLSWYGRVRGSREALALAAETLDLLERHLTDPEHGGFLEAADAAWKPLEANRRQNPHMHLYEAFLALHAARGEPSDLRRADALVELLRRHWVDERGCLREHFAADWSRLPGPEGEIAEPGHHFEWAWLLEQDPRPERRAEHLALSDALYGFATGCGVDADGAVFDQVRADGRVLADSKRVWPQTEYAKALASRAARDPEALERLVRCLELCFARYVDPATGAWAEHARRDGRVFSDALNATSVYHIATAVIEAAAALESARGELTR